ncbi:kinase-like protein [Delitschia confertaspora ATCC 74209]|uniref:Kinase-like protein n=1 Tax=Delitschia confertaspora ATCC 74209 TaxID=1513339 RepID=A0A9P4MU24_9PLEO|nr:kinase-like protein [Delitschia confertaspora ATCC 74209]
MDKPASIIVNGLPRLEIIDVSSPSKPDNYRISPISGHSGYDQSVWNDWSGRGSHVDFYPDEVVPLKEERFLGHGVMGGVYETHCKGIAFAWKRRYCRHKIGAAERKEIEILKKLSHRHIIRLVGTYTHRSFLGLLLHPVAVCDLSTLLEDFEYFYSEQSLDSTQKDRLEKLGLPHGSWNDFRPAGCSLLYSTIGCLANAIEYLHSQDIRHKDLKPANILLSRNQVWLTDFGSATDFSMLSQSATENGERGTPKYFAPEVAQYRPSGRAADIFSLGCIYLEIATFFLQGTLANLRSLRPDMDTSYQANLNRSPQWFKQLKTTSPRYRHLLLEVEQMLEFAPELRPTAAELHRRLVYIDHFRQPEHTRSLFGRCCSTDLFTTSELNSQLQKQKTGLIDNIRNTFIRRFKSATWPITEGKPNQASTFNNNTSPDDLPRQDTTAEIRSLQSYHAQMFDGMPDNVYSHVPLTSHSPKRPAF